MKIEKQLPPKFYTIPNCAQELGLKVHALRRAVNSGFVPYYQPFGFRRYVILSEVVTAIESFSGGQGNE